MSFNTGEQIRGQTFKTSLRLWRYILVAHIGPFLLAFAVTMFVFLLQFLIRFIDKIVGKGLDLWTILQLIALNLAWMVVLAVPMAALVATLMAFGSLTASGELTAMKASGMSFLRMLFPVVLGAFLLAYGDLWFNNQVLPDANHRAKDLMSDIQRKKPTFLVRQGEFTDASALPGYSILTQKTFENSNDLEGIVIYDHTQVNETKVITAKYATFSFTRDFNNLILDLRDGEFHQSPQVQSSDYRNGVFTTYQVRIPTSGYDFMRESTSERGDRELSADDLMKVVRSRDSVARRQMKNLKTSLSRFAEAITSKTPLIQLPERPTSFADIAGLFRQNIFEIMSLSSQAKSSLLDAGGYLVEAHKKYALPVACLVFALLGAPLGALARRGGIGMGVGLSIGFFILYWACLIGGEKLADRGIIAPWLGMWIANMVLGGLGLLLCLRVLKELSGFGFSFFKIKKANKAHA